MIYRFFVPALIVMVGACGASPKAAFYTLSPEATLQPAANVRPVRVTVGSVTVPDLVDKPQMITRTMPNEVTVNEYARWGEPLKENIARTLAADLSRVLGVDNVSIYPPSADIKTYQLRVDVMHFESVIDDSVTLDALWSLRAPDGVSHFDGHTLVHENTKGDGFAAIAAAHSRALAQMSRQIAAALGEMRQ
ncbi:PqiC family protein [Caballeronia sp. LZ001]|uniref:PqiC family protein n=1 Tax=Caballeronia sp. LZ001 TaxID=3038553 RepID=UPI002857531D|nr:PqiC family protein [Caballeronia sp. LZ001]MDR5801432.1 PqiC family protein [Caballeronia sp. LZ001]